MLGHRIIPGSAPDGRKWFVEDLDLLSSLASHRDGNLSLKQWIGSLRGVREGAYSALDDPLPLLQAFVNDVRDFFSS